MSTKTFDFLAGSLALEAKPFHLEIANVIKRVFEERTGTFGYRLTTLGRASEDDVPSFMVITQESGILLIDVVEDRVLGSYEDGPSEYWTTEGSGVIIGRNLTVDLYADEVVSRLKNDLSFYDRRAKACLVPIRSVVVFCNNSRGEIEEIFEKFSSYSSDAIQYTELEGWLTGVPQDYNCSLALLSRIYSLLDGTFIYETKAVPQKEEKLVTVNDYIQLSLKTTFRQDDAQRTASMQLAPGPQRIRGLAGTGKTIVLSLKAAISHKRFSDFKILYLFNTQSLYQHVQALIAKYFTLEAKRPPDFDDRVHVLHAWGGRQKPGLYSNLCRTYGLIPLTLNDVKGQRDALEFIYRDLLTRIGEKITPEYDLVLIDEAQDFPQEVFEIVYKLTKGDGANKRIIWAYDEFQSLRDTQIKGPSELFGVGEEGKANLPDSVLDGEYPGGIKKDFVLPNCYRTPRPVLMTAHGIALGLYADKPNEMFYHPDEWKAIGYSVIEPQQLMISTGDSVEIERPDENSRNILEGILRENRMNPLQLVQYEAFTTNADQEDFIASKVSKLISEDGVPPEEIIIVNLKSGANKPSMLELQRRLTVAGVDSVIPGYVESADVFKPKGFVTITTPFRAKGNEANIVFVINAQQVVDDYTLRMRNAFFVAVTRSRGWCFVSGIGAGMDRLIVELEAIKADFPRFKFVCPDPEQVKSRKTFLNRTEKELRKIQEMLDLFNSDPDVRQLISERLKNS